MASSSRDKRGNVIIQFIGLDKRRHSIRLGKLPDARVEVFRQRIESICVAKKHRQILDGETTEWIIRLSDKLHDKLAAAGLVQPRKSMMLAEFMSEYIAERKEARPRTITNLKTAAKHLTRFFGAEKIMHEVTSTEAEAFCIDMKGRYAEATAARVIKHAKQFYGVAIRRRLVVENPFAYLIPGQMTNPGRKAFVERSVTTKIIESCPDAEWRLIVALTRYGGLRCPSEVTALEWSDVNWAQDRFLVRAYKTEGRWVPIFPELRPYLEESFEKAEPGSVHVIARYRGNANLGTRLKRIAKKAGVSIWPKLFVNMRGSRETELVADYPIHVACAWIGNSVDIAAKHYLVVRESDFARAAKSGAVTHFTGCTDEQMETRFIEYGMNSGNLQPVKREDGIRNDSECPDQESKIPQKRRVFCDSGKSAAKSGAVSGFTQEQLLQAVRESNLDEGVKAALIEMVEGRQERVS